MNQFNWVEVNLSRLDANLAWWRGLLAPSARQACPPGGTCQPRRRAPRRVKICAVVKANAYGMGAVDLAQRLCHPAPAPGYSLENDPATSPATAAGVDMLAVYSPAQAEELFNCPGVDKPILILMPMRALERTEGVCKAVREHRVHLCLNDPGQFELAHQLAQREQVPIRVHLPLDTGMSRGGLDDAQFAQLMEQVAHTPGIVLAGVSTHLASPGEQADFALAQAEHFDRVIKPWREMITPDVIEHIGATLGACRDARYHRSMVRLGLGLHGFGPDLMSGGPCLAGETTHGEDRSLTVAARGGALQESGTLPGILPGAGILPGGGLLPICRWLSRLVHVQAYPQGSPVSYGSTHRLTRPSVLGVIPAGYADGYPLALSNVASVRLCQPSGAVTGHACTVLGKVSMDQIIVDLTDAAAQAPISVGQMVELISSDPAAPNSLPRLAALAGSSCYEMLCRLSPRMPHRYVSVETRTPAMLPMTPHPVR